MNRLIAVFLGISIAFSLVIAASYVFLPSEYKVERSIAIKADHSQIYPYVNDLKQWPNWIAWNKKKDPSLTFTFGQISSGERGVLQWQGEELGDSEIKILESYPLEGVTYQWLMNQRKVKIDAKIKFEPSLESKQTTVIWSCTGQAGNNPVFRYFGLFMDGILTPDLEEGLQNLKELVESEGKLGG